MKIKNNHIRYIHARLTEEEYAHMKLQMTTHGYPSVSGYLRDLIMLKRLPPRRVVCRITDRELRDRINILIYQVNKIGVNYNQVVTLYQKQAKQMRPDGTPYLNTRLLDEKMRLLMRSTEGLRDEFAVILDVIKRYIYLNPEVGRDETSDESFSMD